MRRRFKVTAREGGNDSSTQDSIATVYAHTHRRNMCVRIKRLTVHTLQPVLRVDYVSRNLAAAQRGTITMEGDNLIVLNGGFRVSAPPAGSCQVVISHYGR